MRRINFSTLAVAGLLLTACADKDVIVEGGDTQGEVLADGYVALNIDLPTASSSTRAENDQFDDGLAGEYAVKDCALLIFQEGTTLGESNAQLIWADKADWDYKVSGSSNITTSYRAISSVSKFDKTKQLYALAVLNYQNVMTIANGKATVAQTNIADPQVSADMEIKTLNDLYTAIEGVDLTRRNGADYFFMTNAVLSTKQGGTTATEAPKSEDVFQLAKLTSANIFTTKELAAETPAGEVLVERAVAKATLDNEATTVGGVKEEKTEDGQTKLEDKTLTIKKVEWTIDNIEPSTYIARNPGTKDYIGYTSDYFTQKNGSTNYRFVSASSTEGNSPLGVGAYYRTYWCVDPHYDDDGTETVTMKNWNENPIRPAIDFSECGTNNPLYCYENTFDVANQLYKNTTRAIIKVTLAGEDENPHPNFYTFKGGQVYYTADDAKTHVINSIYENGLMELIKSKVAPGKTLDGINIDFFNKYFEFNDFDGDEEVTAGSVNIKDLKLTTLGENYFNNNPEEGLFIEGTKDAIATALNGILEGVNDELKIQKYVGGVMYYEARFMHFASTEKATDLAPWGDWEDGETYEKPSSTDPYPGEKAEQNYLGRYGMVRNNWYDVTVESFNRLGSPKDPTGNVSSDPTPDDNLNDYISVKIHVLSWAKRGQKWNF